MFEMTPGPGNLLLLNRLMLFFQFGQGDVSDVNVKDSMSYWNLSLLADLWIFLLGFETRIISLLNPYD